ncbi:NAD(P)-dependent oxidoreductase [Flavobacterium sp. DG2-3]|uniref:NAD-dependent epimerase/dehydratase family protein n=1 Tax=Flavobacterium sp. DG2-3 TaxID=3068317 RepID=UPI00273F9F37|nr:SDR family oxidoreductase [Flavobacterium sp. DG2-3]MDP5200714.1 SDR family oxidoreductase [Flavobacterium sp. DG2-3]
MNVLITGAFGFLGRNAAKEYKKRGFHVVGIGHGKWNYEDYAVWGIDQWVETTIKLDVLLALDISFDIIIHCGGSGSVAFSNTNPYEDFQRSVQSTLALLEFIRLKNKNCKFIYPSSPAVQGNLGNIPIKEEMSGIPASPYGFHKKIAEEICFSYHKNFNIQIGIIRYFSIYGEGLKKQLLWDACKKLSSEGDLEFFGTGKETRDWIHISDATSLMGMFSDQLKDYQVVNAGVGKVVEISDVIKKLSHCFKNSRKINFNGLVKEGDPIHFLADTKKAFELGWIPKISLEMGLENYVEYFKKHMND